MKPALLALLLSALLLAGCSRPSDAPGATSDAAAETSEPGAPTVASAEGTVAAIDVDAGTITVAHGPVEALQWPAMTMAFKASPEQMAAVKVRDRVEFEFQSGTNVLTRIVASRHARPTPSADAGVSAATTPATPTGQVKNDALPLVVVHKNPTCGCCGLWVEHLREAGFPVEVRDVDNLDPVKQRLGVPYGKGSCHTAEVAGYMVEGHVPASDIRRLLTEKPKARGLVLPGMPVGSPGMEVPSGVVQPYTVELVRPDGSTVDYAKHGAEPGA